LDPFPKCKAFCDKFMGLEEIKAYLLRWNKELNVAGLKLDLQDSLEAVNIQVG
jgi:hypothetical protein